jgi:hypothetical protein
MQVTLTPFQAFYDGLRKSIKEPDFNRQEVSEIISSNLELMAELFNAEQSDKIAKLNFYDNSKIGIDTHLNLRAVRGTITRNVCNYASYSDSIANLKTFAKFVKFYSKNVSLSDKDIERNLQAIEAAKKGLEALAKFYEKGGESKKAEKTIVDEARKKLAEAGDKMATSRASKKEAMGSKRLAELKALVSTRFETSESKITYLINYFKYDSDDLAKILASEELISFGVLCKQNSTVAKNVILFLAEYVLHLPCENPMGKLNQALTIIASCKTLQEGEQKEMANAALKASLLFRLTLQSMDKKHETLPSDPKNIQNLGYFALNILVLSGLAGLTVVFPGPAMSMVISSFSGIVAAQGYNDARTYWDSRTAAQKQQIQAELKPLWDLQASNPAAAQEIVKQLILDNDPEKSMAQFLTKLTPHGLQS